MAKNDKETTKKPLGYDNVEYANSEAKNIYNTQKGNTPWLQPLNGTSKQALSRTATIARKNIPGLGSAYSLVNANMKNNGMTPDMQGVASDIRSGMDEVSGYLQPFASGQYQEDPRLLAQLDRERTNATNAAATRFGGGRYGSVGMGIGMGQTQAAATDGLMLQSNENARNRQLQAASQLGSLNLQGNGLLGQMYDSGAGRAMQSASMLPALNNLRYDGVSRLAGVGDYRQNRSQTQADQIRNHSWDQLGKYNAIINGNGRLGSTTTTPGPSMAQSVLGGAATGGALLGPWGAVGGGLLGAFS